MNAGSLAGAIALQTERPRPERRNDADTWWVYRHLWRAAGVPARVS